MLRVLRTISVVAAILVAGATLGLSFLSFVRKVDSFTRPGFSYERSRGALVVRSVEAGGAAQAAGLSPGDRILTADGQSGGSL
ncbi:MAG TPA: PDZ domain-containing protein, partial [Thermoanaerobaculia bacterium]|nr:PDZ domain-containing protein [Thermoanaerobaculia bacterium]